VIGSLVALVAGGALFGVSLKRRIFVRVMGPTLNTQYRFQRRLPKAIEYSEKSHLTTARMIAIVLGGLLVVAGLAGLAVSVR
jgi:hypothetical protein